MFVDNADIDGNTNTHVLSRTVKEQSGKREKHILYLISKINILNYSKLTKHLENLTPINSFKYRDKIFLAIYN